MPLFRLLDPILNSLNQGPVFRTWAARLLEILAWVLVASGVLAFLVLFASTISNARHVLGGSANLVLGGLVLALVVAAGGLANACVASYRSRTIAGLPDSERTLAWVLTILLLFIGEEAAVSCAFAGLGVFTTAVFAGAAMNELRPGAFSASPGMIGGLASMLSIWGFGLMGLVLTKLVAQWYSATIEIADLMRAGAPAGAAPSPSMILSEPLVSAVPAHPSFAAPARAASGSVPIPQMSATGIYPSPVQNPPVRPVAAAAPYSAPVSGASTPQSYPLPVPPAYTAPPAPQAQTPYPPPQSQPAPPQPPAGLRCNQCGASVPRGTRFCQVCGANLSA